MMPPLTTASNFTQEGSPSTITLPMVRKATKPRSGQTGGWLTVAGGDSDCGYATVWASSVGTFGLGCLPLFNPVCVALDSSEQD